MICSYDYNYDDYDSGYDDDRYIQYMNMMYDEHMAEQDEYYQDLAETIIVDDLPPEYKRAWNMQSQEKRQIYLDKVMEDGINPDVVANIFWGDVYKMKGSTA